MTALTLLWIPLVVAALLSGACFVAVLTVRKGAEPVMAILGLSSFGLANYALILLVSGLGRIDAVIYGLAFLIGGAVGGWVFAASLLDRVARVPKSPVLDTPLAPKNQTAVIVMSCVEPPEYDPRESANMLTALADEELISPSLGTLPFLFFAQKARYRAIGGRSPAQSELRTLADRLESRLSDPRIGKVAAATCAGPERLAVRVAEAFRLGFTHVVVAEALVAESLQTAEAKREVDLMRPEEVDGLITYTSELGDAECIINMLARRAVNGDLPPSELGVVLVGHGQPEPLARRDPEFDLMETAFLNRVRMALVERGVPESNVRVAWADWNTPDVTSVIRHLAALGCRRVAVAPAVFPFTSIGTLLDLDISVREARVDDAVSVVTLSAWRDDDAVVEELAERVLAAL